MNDPTRPGLQSSEFWLTLLMALAPALSIIFKHDVSSDLQQWSILLAGVTTVAYTISRSVVKKSAITATQPPATVVNSPSVQISSPTVTTGPTTSNPAVYDYTKDPVVTKSQEAKYPPKKPRKPRKPKG